MENLSRMSIKMMIEHIRKLDADCQKLSSYLLNFQEKGDQTEYRRTQQALESRHTTMAQLAVSLSNEIEMYILTNRDES